MSDIRIQLSDISYQKSVITANEEDAEFVEGVDGKRDEE